MKINDQQPVIILGMHRSGTTMLSRHLEELGIFMGHKKDRNNESTFFMNFNDWILKQVYARWDMPENYYYLKNHTLLRNDILDAAFSHMSFFKNIEYLGLKKFAKYQNILNLDIPWGWKDPRNSFTVDIWKEVFPAAKLIHIYRHPLDVAESLRKREINNMERYQNNLKLNVKKKLGVKNLGYNHSMSVIDIINGVDLWKEYVYRADQMILKYGGLSIKYEEYLDDPSSKLNEILTYLEIGSHIDLNIFNSKVDNSRKYSYSRKKELLNLNEKIKDDSLVKYFGYDVC